MKAKIRHIISFLRLPINKAVVCSRAEHFLIMHPTQNEMTKKLFLGKWFEHRSNVP